MSLNYPTFSPLIQASISAFIAAHQDAPGTVALYDLVVGEVERTLIQSALTFTKGNQLRASELLGINRNTLRRKMTGLKIEQTRKGTSTWTH